MVPRLCECCRQSQAEVVSKSSNQTWGLSFSRALYVSAVRGRDGLASSKMDFIPLGTGLCYCWSYFMEITSVNVLRALGQNLGIRYAYAHYLTFVPGRVHDSTMCFDWLLV